MGRRCVQSTLCLGKRQTCCRPLRPLRLDLRSTRRKSFRLRLCLHKTTNNFAVRQPFRHPLPAQPAAFPDTNPNRKHTCGFLGCTRDVLTGGYASPALHTGMIGPPYRTDMSRT